MQSFRDNEGRTWTVVVTVAGVKRVRATVGIDIPSLPENNSEGLARLIGDPVALVDVIYLLCRDQADALGLTDETFAEAIAGDALKAAADAFLAAFADFFPEPRIRAGIRQMIELGKKAEILAARKMDRMMATLDLDALAETLISPSGDAPASSGSTPDPSPSEN